MRETSRKLSKSLFVIKFDEAFQRPLSVMMMVAWRLEEAPHKLQASSQFAKCNQADQVST
ncbi:hypothetical protein CCR93_18355 [Rhodobium orientis]|nr:hypothetical protein [Rhodobium orientis]